MKDRPCLLTSFKMELFIQVSGSTGREMAWAFKNGLMEANTLGTGKRAKLMGMARCSMLMEMFMKESGLKIKRTVMANTSEQMAQFTKAAGKMTCSMEKDLKNGLTVLTMKEISKMALKKAMACFTLLMAVFMKANLARMKSME